MAKKEKNKCGYCGGSGFATVSMLVAPNLSLICYDCTLNYPTVKFTPYVPEERLTATDVEERQGKSTYSEAKKAVEILTRRRGDTKEKVNHPDHYQGKYECIEVIKDLKLNFNMGSAFKYIWRADRKENRREDIEKAIFYLQWELDNG